MPRLLDKLLAFKARKMNPQHTSTSPATPATMSTTTTTSVRDTTEQELAANNTSAMTTLDEAIDTLAMRDAGQEPATSSVSASPPRNDSKVATDERDFAQKRAIVLASTLMETSNVMAAKDATSSTASTLKLLSHGMFHEAVDVDDIDVVKFMLARRIDVDARYEGCTPLMRAARHGRAALAELLLTHGASVDAMCEGSPDPETNGFTSLHWAMFTENIRVLEILLEHGADVEARCKGYTPLMMASGNGKSAVVEVLLAHGASVDAVTKDASEDPDGYASIHLAALSNHVSVLEKLVARGSSVNAKTLDGKTALQVARADGKADANSEAANWLLAHGVLEQ